ncbi:MAG: ABC transporter permease [Lachnospiraceae bacterium]|nr:ABC transporter permease [Lachnospiraceae bacterium]
MRKNYFFLQLKRSFAAFTRMIGSVIVMIALSVLLAWGVSKSFSNAPVLEQITLGIGMEENEDQTEVFLDLIAGMSSVESICKFEYMTEDEAFEKLENKEIEAAIVLPQNFYDDVNYGTNTPLVIYFSSEVDPRTSLFRELLIDGVSFARISEAAIYSVLDMRDVYALKMTAGETSDFLTDFYMWQILERGSAFDNRVLAATGEVNLEQYYITVGVLIFLLLGSLTFGFLYKEEEQMLYKKLRLMGITSALVSGTRVLIMAIYSYCTMLLSYVVGMIISAATETFLFQPSALVLFLLIPVALAMGAFANLIYSLAKNQSQGMLINLGVNVVMLVCAGGILPIYYFPKAIRIFGNLLPLRYWLMHLQMIFFGSASGFVGKSFLIVSVELVFAAICYGVSILITEHKK